MPRFLGDRDIAFFRQINKELLQQVVETPVIVYKLDIQKSRTNLYGESLKKAYLIGVQVTCLINRQDKTPTSDGFVLDTAQSATFSFLRETLQEKSIYPESGDIIEYDQTFYEIDNVSENQLLGAQPFLNWAIICTTHMTKKSALQLEVRPNAPTNLE